MRVVLVPEVLGDVGALAAAVAEPGPVALVGGEGVFCRGLGDTTPERLPALARLLLAIRGRPAATIAVVTGDALGGGLGLAAVCDVVVAHPRARFGLPEALFGLVPAVVTPLLHERTLPQVVRRLAVTGDAVGAEEALRLGLADVIDPAPDLARWGRTLGRAEPGAVARVKALPPGLAEAVLAAADVTAGLLKSPAARTRRARFAEGFAPWEEA